MIIEDIKVGDRVIVHNTYQFGAKKYISKKGTVTKVTTKFHDLAFDGYYYTVKFDNEEELRFTDDEVKLLDKC